MESSLKTKIEEIIEHLEQETVNSVSKIKLDSPEKDEERTKNILITVTTTLWLKYCIQSDLSYQDFESKAHLFDEVINEPKYQTAGIMSQISYLANQIAEKRITSKVDIANRISDIKNLDENEFYINKENPLTAEEEPEAIIKKSRKISTTAAKDGAKLIKMLLSDEEFVEKLKKSGYKIDEAYSKPEKHQEEPLLGQIKISEEVSDRISKIVRETKPSLLILGAFIINWSSCLFSILHFLSAIKTVTPCLKRSPVIVILAPESGIMAGIRDEITGFESATI